MGRERQGTKEHDKVTKMVNKRNHYNRTDQKEDRIFRRKNTKCITDLNVNYKVKQITRDKSDLNLRSPFRLRIETIAIPKNFSVMSSFWYEISDFNFLLRNGD